MVNKPQKRKLTEEHKKKCGEAISLAWKKRNGIPTKRKGSGMKDEVRKKISIKKKGMMKGENHWNWKGGTSRAYKTGYYSVEYKEWRESVFMRDDYTCQQCFGERGQYITAHHIKSFAQYPELRFEISNGLTLCEKCHSETDNYRGRKNKKITN